MGTNMSVITSVVLNVLPRLYSVEGQTTMGRARFAVSLFFFLFLTQQDANAHNSSLDFICDPETNKFHKELCFSQYSAELNPLMRPYQFFLVTACILVVLWIVIIQYAHTHLPKITSKNKQLLHKLWKWNLLHVGSEAVVVSVMLGLFIYTQEFKLPETYNCTWISAPVMICVDVHRSKKQFLNWLLIGTMAVMLLLCIWTLQQMCNKQKFIKELLGLKYPRE